MQNKNKLYIGFSIIASLLVLSCFPVTLVKADIEYYFPDDEGDDTWEEKSLEALGLDPDIIEDMYDYILDNQYYIQSILISREGYIIHDEYLENFVRRPVREYGWYPGLLFGVEEVRGDRHAMWSVTKSVTSLLTSIAIERGNLTSVNERFFDIFPDRWSTDLTNATEKLDITIEDILTMTTGLNWSEGDDALSAWPESGYSISYIINKSLVTEPGMNFTYNTGNTELLAAVLQNVTNTKLSDFAQQYLFDPIGVDPDDLEWDEDPWEWATPSLPNITHGGFGIYTTPRVMARIGELCLNNGTWNGTQVVSSEWIYNMTQEHATPVGLGEEAMYGYLWWLRPEYYSAVGLFGQQISIIPELNMVVAITSDTIDLSAPDLGATPNCTNEIIYKYIIPAAKADNLSVSDPIENSAYSTNAPDYQIYAEKEYRNATWYTIDGGSKTIFSDFSGTINQTIWDGLSMGNHTISFNANNSEGVIETVTRQVIKDTDDPIVVLSFAENSYGQSAPNFTVSVTDDLPVQTWYTIDNGVTNTTFTGTNRAINQTQWDNLSEGNVTVIVYARDSAGNIGSDEVTIKKSIPDEAIPGYPLLFILGFGAIITILIIRKFKFRMK
ncbi:MAG: serine hydrolase [Promethearchaeota archaeon]